MKSFKIESIIGCAAVTAVLSMPSFADDVASVTINDLFSTTFDNAAQPLPDDGTFTGAFPDAATQPRQVSFTNVGTNNGGTTVSGTGVVYYDGTILRLGSILFPDQDVQVLPGLPQETNITTSGAAIVFSGPATDTESGFTGFQVDGTNDANNGTDVVADFSHFADVIETCVGPLCSLIDTLDLDGVRYQIDGTLTPAGGDTIIVTIQTANDSVYSVSVDTIVIAAEGDSASNVASFSIIDLFSTTFDNAAQPLPDDGTFTGAYPDASTQPRQVAFSDVGTANGGITETGTGILSYDGSTLFLSAILFTDQDVQVLPGLPQETNITTSGASLSFAAPKQDTESGFAGFQVDGTNDADSSTDVVADFSHFADVIETCVGPLCSLIDTLDLDGVRYQIDGNLTAEGGDTITVTVQTANDSVYQVNVLTQAVVAEAGENVPFPTAFIILGGLALLGIARKSQS